MSDYDIRETLDFLIELKANNHKEWFDAHRKRYLSVKAGFEVFVQEVIGGISAFDPSVADVKAKNCMYRINRDIRFSHNKEPYKTHLGAFICAYGRHSTYAGYYVHLEAPGSEYIGDNILAAGSYMPSTKELESIRTEIYDNPTEFKAALAKAKGFSLEIGTRLQRVPRGFPTDFELAEYLKYKNYSISKAIPAEQLAEPGLAEWVVGQFRATAPFTGLLNRAIDYAKKEM